MTIITMRYLKDTVAIEKRCQEEKGPIFVTKNGYGKLVVMDVEYYEELTWQLREARMLYEGLDDIKNGRVIDGETVRKRLGEKYGI